VFSTTPHQTTPKKGPLSQPQAIKNHQKITSKLPHFIPQKNLEKNLIDIFRTKRLAEGFE
jgi:hypothetical protein